MDGATEKEIKLETETNKRNMDFLSREMYEQTSLSWSFFALPDEWGPIQAYA